MSSGEGAVRQSLLALAVPLMATILIVLAAGVMWTLVDQNRALKSALEATNQLPGNVPRVEAGDSLALGDLLRVEDGAEATFGGLLGPRGATVVFFTTTCPYCQATLPIWKDLAEQVVKSDGAFLAISLDAPEETRAYIEANQLPWPVYSVPRDAAAGLNIKTVPTTVTLSSMGIVKGAWFGQLHEFQTQEIIDTVEAQD